MQIKIGVEKKTCLIACKSIRKTNLINLDCTACKVSEKRFDVWNETKHFTFSLSILVAITHNIRRNIKCEEETSKRMVTTKIKKKKMKLKLNELSINSSEIILKIEMPLNTMYLSPLTMCNHRLKITEKKLHTTGIRTDAEFKCKRLVFISLFTRSAHK